MGRYLKYTFPAAEEDAVCAAQTRVGAGSLILNGTLSNSINSMVSFIDNGYAREISITSAGGVTGINFTVVGMQNNVPITEVIAGGGAGVRVLSTQIYDTIISISTSATVVNPVTVGTGVSGYFKVLNIDLETPVMRSASISVLNSQADDPIIYNIYKSPSKLYSANKTYEDILDAPNEYGLFLVGTENATASTTNSITTPISSIIIALTGNTDNPGSSNNSITLIFMQ